MRSSSTARHGWSNLTPSRSRSATRRTLTAVEIEHWVDTLITERGDDGMNRLRDQARALAPVLGRATEFQHLDRLISAALTTGDLADVGSDRLLARAVGLPFDERRLAAFEALAADLVDRAPDVVPALEIDQSRRRLLAFYEAYFSNFIEGTEFTLDEAAAIVFDHAVRADRPADAPDIHDIHGTYDIVADVTEMSRVPGSAVEFEQLLLRRHATLMGGRPDKLPGRFKERANRAGTTEFVSPDLVIGTLRQGFDIGRSVVSPFARAVYMMFLTAEVHPFTDGNGRVARIMMNAELVSAGEVRIIIPTVYRNNYLSALRGATHNGHFAALYAMVDFARRWTAQVDFASRPSAEADLARTNATREATEAENAGVRLVLPASSSKQRPTI